MKVPCMIAVALATAAAPLVAQEASKTVSVAPDARVRIENSTGPTSVSGWDRNEVQVEARGSGARDVDIRSDRRRVDISAPASVSLTVRVPRGVILDVRSGSGSVRISDVENTIEVEAGSGTVNIDATPRSITAVGFSGGVRIRGGGTEITRAESASGSVSVSQARGVVDLTSTSGSVTATGQVRDAKLYSVSGSVLFDGVVERGGRLSAESTSGSVTLLISAGTPAEYELMSVSGHVRNSFGPRPQPPTHGPGASLRFAVGSGGGRIRATSMSGSVILNER